MQPSQSNTGLFFAFFIMGSWATSTILLMQWHVNFANPLLYLFILVQMHLYTGLFITAHDAMHSTVAANKTLNNAVGYTCTFLYALFWYPKLYSKHHRHHKNVHTINDPDYYESSFFRWYWQFVRNYLSIWQIVAMAVLFNIFELWIPQTNLLLFWVLPSILSTFQLFYFGTYAPHKGEHDNPHQSRSQKRNHLLAFFSCYFFGYHYEHHDSPGTPWWQLYKAPLKAK
jgi:beta-carotene ketolase (CrtW type)